MTNAKSTSTQLKRALGLDSLDMASSENFDQITRLAAFCFNATAAMIWMRDGPRGAFVSLLGVPDTFLDAAGRLCEATLRDGGVLQHADPSPGSPGSPGSAGSKGTPGVPIPKSTGTAAYASPSDANASPLVFFVGMALTDDAGRAVGVLAIADGHAREFANAERDQLKALARLAMNEVMLKRSVGRRDALTGLPNERQLIADLSDLAQTASGEYRLLAMVDTFDAASAQSIALSMGRGPIEALMVEMAERLCTYLEGIAEVYHVAETRFAFVLPSEPQTGPLQQEKLIDALFQTVGKTALAGGVPIRPPLRAGLVNFRLHEGGVGEALRKAIAAADDSVAANRTWTSYDADKEAFHQRSYGLATGLQRGLANDEFYLLYQPRLDLKTGRIVSLEALARWKHSVLGTLFPGEFIPIVEQTAVMQALTAWVLDTGLKQLARWQLRCPWLRLSVNLSPVDFESGELVMLLTQTCRQHDIAPGMLEVEVKEGDWMRKASVLDQLRAIRSSGMVVAIDDFGSGYSNTAYLRDIPADIIKLDASLVLDLAENDRHQRIAHAILDLAHDLGYRTVAEGVETEATLALLREWRCDEAQGYLIARPMGVEAVTEIVHEYRGPVPRA